VGILDMARPALLAKGDVMQLSADVKAFAQRIGHNFANPALLVRAITHASLASPTRPDNERLEFLGDRVLGLVMAEALFLADATAREGQMAPRYNALVRKETCADVARDIGLGDVLKLGRSEMLSGGRRKDALLGDALEAVIAAVYLDAGFDAARALILRLWAGRIGAVAQDARDAKSALQEWAQARGMAPPTYTELARSGPDHGPIFTVEVRLDTGECENASAGSKRTAEQSAARALLARMEG
jgi:ribonuclease III